MHFGSKMIILFGMLVAPALAFGQNNCTTGARIEGVVTDPTGAIVVGAEVQASDGTRVLSDTAGRYIIACIPAGMTTLRLEAQGFSPISKKIEARTGETVRLNVQFFLAAVEIDVQVNAEGGELDNDQGSNTVVLNTQQIQQLADDPDDFVRQLQVLAAESVGDPSNAHITVDGFQNPGVLPPKGSNCLNPHQS